MATNNDGKAGPSSNSLSPSLGQALQRVKYTAAPLVGPSSATGDVLNVEPLSVAVPPCSVPFIFAHRQWRAGLLMADAIEQGAFPVAGKQVLELGAGTALPSLASWRKGAAFTLATDYDAEPLVEQLKLNVSNNVPRGSPEAKRIKALGYTWAVASDDVLDELPSVKPMSTASGFDVILTADCMWDQLSHTSLISAFRALLAKSADSRIYVVAGLHTGRDVICSCLRRAHKAGLVLRELPHHAAWPVLPADAHASNNRSDDDPLRDSAYILELALKHDAERSGVPDEQDAEIHAQGPWLSGERRTFVEEERPEEKKEVGGVKIRNGWITVWSLGWAEEQLQR